jgi:thiamine-monophosphate kinase
MAENPENQERTDIGELGEFALIDHLTKNFDTHNASTLQGIGDDAAILESLGKQTVVSTDMLVEGVHFDLSYLPLKHLGYKSVVVNLSDIYAMNAEPTQITFSMALSNRFSVEALEELYDGVHLACQEYGVDLIGGDTTSSQSGLIISVTAIGEVNESGAVTRSGAQENDLICVSGDLGGAFMGLLLMEREKKIYLENPEVQPDLEGHEYIMQRLMKPEARKDIINWLNEQKIVPTSMMDISDGLSSELFHITTKSKVGCTVYESKIPVHIDTQKMAMDLKMASVTAALNGGEDYELLFTIPQSDYEKITMSEEISVIGHITKDAEKRILITNSENEVPLEAQGWNPLKK